LYSNFDHLSVDNSYYIGAIAT